VNPAATDEEVRVAHRDLTKVWHPDRFAHDAEMQRKAQEKLKAINMAYDTIRAVRTGSQPPGPPFRSEWIWAIGSALAGLFMLLRRPTLGGLMIAVILLGLSVYFIRRMRERVR
jgi:hypothetical protein